MPRGDGFAPSDAAVRAASGAAETVWWWEEDDAAAGGGSWRTRLERCDAATGSLVAVPADDARARPWTPWRSVCDASEAPYFRWFAGANTNACFNAVDAPVLRGRGDDCAFTCLPEEIGPDAPRVNVTRRELLGAVARFAAHLASQHGVEPRDRVLFHAPTDAAHCVAMLACQRLGAAYSCTSVDTAESVLAQRVEDLRPKLVIACEGKTQHAGVAVDCAAKAERVVAALRSKTSAGSSTGDSSPPPSVLLLPPWHRPPPAERAARLRWSKLSDREAVREASRLAPCAVCASDHPLFVSYTSGSTGRPKGVVHGHGGYVWGVKESMRVVFECGEDTEHPREGADGVSGGILTVGSSGWITGQSYMLMGPLLAGCRSVMMAGSPAFPSVTRPLETASAERVTLFKSGSAAIRALMTDPTNARKLDAVDLGAIRCATFCAEPVSVEVHAYAQRHATRNFINSYWATEHGAMVFSRDVRRKLPKAPRTTPGPGGRREEDDLPADARTWPLPWVESAIDPETSDVIITSPYPSLALTVFGRPEAIRSPTWRGDLRRYAETYWPAGAGGFVQGDVARRAEGGGVTFHGRSDEVINVNGNRVGTEQVERCLWAIEAKGVIEASAAGGGKGPDADASAARKNQNPSLANAALDAGRAARRAGVDASESGGARTRTHEWTGSGDRLGSDARVSRVRFGVKDCCVVGAPDFVKGSSPVAFVVFERVNDSDDSEDDLGRMIVPDVAAFKRAASRAAADLVGSHAAPDHVFAVVALPKTITGKTARKTLQLLLAGEAAPDASLRDKSVLPPLAEAVRRWRRDAATESRGLDLASYWRRYRFSDHVVRGRAIVPGAGWLCVLAKEADAGRLADVSFMRGVHDEAAEVRVVKRRRTMQATVGDEVVLRASVAAEPPAPDAVLAGTEEEEEEEEEEERDGSPGGGSRSGGEEDTDDSPVDTDDTDEGSDEGGGSPRRPGAKRLGGGGGRGGPDEKTRRAGAAKTGGKTSSPAVVSEEATKAQHYRRCEALRLSYAGDYRAVERVEWSGYAFRAEVSSARGNLAAVLDAGLQVVCCSARANTFIPVAVKEFHVDESRVGAWLEAASASDDDAGVVVRGEILEQHPEFIVADLRYERRGSRAAEEAGAETSRRRTTSPSGSKKRKKNGDAETLDGAAPHGASFDTGPGGSAFAAMGRVRFARVEGSRPRLQPAPRPGAGASTGRAQTLDPATALARLRQLTPEQRIESVRDVVRKVVEDLTELEPDFSKSAFDNGMHSLAAVELLSRVNASLGTGVTTKLVVADAPMSEFVEKVADHAVTYSAPKTDDPDAKPFPNVDYEGLNEVVRRRLAGRSVGQTPYWFLARYFAYNWFKKAFQFFRIGGHRFVLDPPREIDLGVEVSMNRRVEFRDIDMNQHYTVEMIVARSVDGVEQLMARAGLSHVELYYKRNIFAAKIQSTFHKELALGDAYKIRTKITKVVGSLMDIRVAFLDERETLCFEILWTILIVLDSTERILLDWENVDLMEGKKLKAGPGKHRVEAPATPGGATASGEAKK
jgi:acyl-coenzyme A synthetase/AMP-(fatty) acid ligase/acyl-CoA thioesterase FadM